MWFKNLVVFRLPAPWNISVDKLEECLSKNSFRRCQSNESASSGWVSPRPRGENNELVVSVGGQWLAALCVEQKILPSSVIKDEVKERAAAIELQQGYSPGRKQLSELRERVAEELLPRAFTKRSTTFVWIDPVGGWLVVNASSPAKSDAVIEALMFCIDEFPVYSVETELSPCSAMSDWLAGSEAPDGFTIDQDCEVKSVDESKASIRYARYPINDEAADEIKNHLASGRLPTRLALTWDDRISFVLTEKMEIKRLSFLDILKEEAQQDAATAEEVFEADFSLMTGELSRFIPALISALGGEIDKE